MTEASQGSKRVAAAAVALLLMTALLVLYNSDLQRGGAAARHILRFGHAAAASGATAAEQLQPPPNVLSASLPPPPPAPSPEVLEAAAEAAVVAAHCTAERRAQYVAAVANGSIPSLLAGGWTCNGLDQVSGVLAYLVPGLASGIHEASDSQLLCLEHSKVGLVAAKNLNFYFGLPAQPPALACPSHCSAAVPLCLRWWSASAPCRGGTSHCSTCSLATCSARSATARSGLSATATRSGTTSS